jgi:hypothetical protein
MKKKSIYIIYIYIVLNSCGITETQNKGKSVEPKGIETFNNIFSKVPINNIYYSVDSAVMIEPKIDFRYVTQDDTIGSVFFQLFDGSKSFIIGVNYLLCYSYIVNQYNGYHYPHNYSIFPYDFSTLNQSNFDVNFNCNNTDNSSQRALNIDKTIYGKWLIDSILDANNKITEGISSLLIDEKTILINDTLEFNYNVDGFYLNIEKQPAFFRIFNNYNKMIFYSLLNNENNFYFAHKILDGGRPPHEEKLNK